MMGTEKQRPKGGASYVGGFFQLFDWNSKSRKKLFSKKSELPERSKQGKLKDANFPTTRFILVEEDEARRGMMIMKGSSDYSCSSSVTDDDGYGTKVPSVVARLMGLDSLPSNTLPEMCPTPPFDSQSLDDTIFNRKTHDFNHTSYSLNSSAAPMIPADPNPPKIPKTPMKKFQTEVLPPKSAKSVPITRHRIMSPVKSHSLAPRKNADNIMEAAARIIEHGSQHHTKVGAKSSLPAPLRVGDLKEKKMDMDPPRRSSKFSYIPRRPTESSAAKQLKGQSLTKSWNGSLQDNNTSMRVCVDMGGASSSGQVKSGEDRSISLAIQAKVNVQRRGERLQRCSGESSMGDKVELKVTQSFALLPSRQRGLPRKSANTCSVLRQNNQKQNTAMADKGKLKLSSTPISKERKPAYMTPESSAYPPRNPSCGCAAPVKAAGSRKGNNGGSDCSEKGGAGSRGKVSVRRRRSVVGESREEEKGIRTNSEEGRERWGGGGKKGMDVVSFTFTAPMTRDDRGPEASERRSGQNPSPPPPSKGKKIHEFDMKLCSLGFDVMRGDALGVLLEQKLNELTCVTEPSSDGSEAGPSPGSDQSNCGVVRGGDKDGARLILPDKRDHSGLFEAMVDGSFGCDYSPGAQGVVKKHKHQEDGGDDRCSNQDGTPTSEETQPLHRDHFLDHFLAESCNSSDTVDDAHSSIEGTGLSSSVVGQDLAGAVLRRPEEADLSDSAVSKLAHGVGPTQATAELELDYVEEILSWVEAGGGDDFEQLEARKGRGGDRVRRRVIFECVGECLREWRPGGAAAGGGRRGLAERVYGEICRWRRQGDCMVDELVGLDMSSRRGRWLEFEDDVLEFVKKIEGDLLHLTVDDLVGEMAAAASVRSRW